MEVADDFVPSVEGSIEGDEAKVVSELIETEEVVDGAADEVVEESPSHEEGIAEDELPAGWMSSVDETTGKTFYYNEETGESSWERPNVKVEVVDDVSKDEASVVIGSYADVQERETGEEPAKEVEEMIAEEEAIATEKSPQNGQLPPGWSEAVHEGNTYYYNEETGETSWERPSVEKLDEDQIENVPTGDTELVSGEDDVNMPEESHANEVVDEPTAFDGAEEEEPTTLDEADELTAMSKNELLAIIAQQKDDIASMRIQYNFLVRCYNNYRKYHSIKVQHLIERYHQVSTISGALQTIATRLARLLPVRRKRVNDDNDETIQSPKRMRCW